jgi:hypothetical protein
MTNEEIIEELLHKAHIKGFYDKMMERVIKYRIKHPEMKLYDRYHKAYEKCKLENGKK